MPKIQVVGWCGQESALKLLESNWPMVVGQRQQRRAKAQERCKAQP